jgi:hypothetical protein
MHSYFLKNRKRAIVATAVVFLVIMIAPGVLVGYYYRVNDTLTAQEIAKEQTLSDVASLALKIKLDTLVSIASSMASSSALSAYTAKGQWTNAANAARDMENSVNFYDPFIDRIIIYDASATQQAAYPALSGGLGTNASGSAWYGALASGDNTFYVTNVQKRTSLPQIQVVNIDAPIKSSGKIVGFLVMQIPADNFLEFGEGLSLGTYGFAYVVDSAANIVANPKYGETGSVVNYASVPQVEKVITGSSGTDIVSDGSGEESVVTYKPVETYGWGIILQEPYTEAFSTRSGILLSLMLLIIVIIIVDILIAYIIFRWLTAKNNEV